MPLAERPKDPGMSDKEKMTEEALTLAGTAHMAGRIVSDRDSELILTLIRQSPHAAAPVPCTTCRKITAMLGKPFWCLRVALEAAHKKARLVEESA